MGTSSSRGSRGSSVRGDEVSPRSYPGGADLFESWLGSGGGGGSFGGGGFGGVSSYSSSTSYSSFGGPGGGYSKTTTSRRGPGGVRAQPPLSALLESNACSGTSLTGRMKVDGMI